MGLLLSRSHLHCVNNSLQSAFYTDRLRTSMATRGGGGGGGIRRGGGTNTAKPYRNTYKHCTE